MSKMLSIQKYGFAVRIVMIFNRIIGSFNLKRLYSSVKMNYGETNPYLPVIEKKLTSCGNVSTNGWFERT
ncbi:hypothetical protein [Pedobacter sp. FW305-3-2-15-E-R2A2]|jgi:hypothetical protein|uniref:hypothetical protein n=1 Tax=Pedobacter sp. FW305-3-2-15-E-R2A2 TaxID=3140251 RepID=UPI0031404BB6